MPQVQADRMELRDRTLLGHPVGLFVLFFTEMWERFSYYGMRSLLVLYMMNHLIGATEKGMYVFGFSTLRGLLESTFGPMTVQPLASQIYGTYTALVYLTPLFGGLLADRLLGQRKTVVLGGVLMAIGHFLMAIESLFLLALLFLIVGNGCFKPNISTQVGGLYPEGDPRRDRAFAIFYMGVNLGAFFSPLICGTLGQVYGWHYGFGAAGVGMVAGLILYLWGQKYLAEDPKRRNQEKTEASGAVPLTQAQWLAIGGLVTLAIINILFWAVFEQQGNTLQVFADRSTDWTVLGVTMPSTWFQAVNPFFIFALTPLVVRLWKRQDARGKEPDSVTKMAMGCVALGLSFTILMYVGNLIGPGERVSFLWLVGATMVATLGEIYLSPIGLSLVTKVAPPQYVSALMGMWYLSSFFGNFLSGYIGTFYEKMNFASFFSILMILGLIAGGAIFALRRPLKKAVGHAV